MNASDVILNYSPGDSASVTFTRVSSGTAINTLGQVFVVGNNVLRIQYEDLDGDQVREKPGFLIENARTQRALSNNTFSGTGSSWFYVGPVTINSGYVNVGAFDLSKISDTSVVSGSYIGFNYNGFTNKPWAAGDGIGVKPYSFFWTKSDSEGSLGSGFNLTDTTDASNTRFSATVKGNVDGSPQIIMTSGTFIGWEELLQVGGRRIFRLHFQTGVVNPANEHIVRISPCNFSPADIGDVIVGGLQIEDIGEHGTSLIWPLTTNVASSFTRTIDTLTLPVDFLPQDLTVLVEHARPVYSGISNITTSPGLMAISQVVPGASLFVQVGNPISYGLNIRDGAANILGATTSIPAGRKQTVVGQYRDLTVSGRAKLTANGVFNDTVGTTLTGFQRWGEQVFYVGARIGSNPRLNGVITRVVVAKGLLSWLEMQHLEDRPYISWTDSSGRANLTLSLPRFSNWSPTLNEFMDTASVVGTGVRYKTVYRTDYLASTTANNMKAADLALVMRLKQHLTGGGTVYVVTNDTKGTAYEAKLSPDGDVVINFTNPQVQEYSVGLDFKNVAAAPMVVYY